MFRDRTNLYIAYRQSYARHPSKKPRLIRSRDDFDDYLDRPSQSDERRGLISGGAGGGGGGPPHTYEDDGDAIIEMDVLPPRWVDAQEEVTELLSDIAHQSAQLTKLHQKHVLPGFGDEDVRRRDEVEIERLTQEITRGFRDCQRAIAKIDRMVKETKDGGAGGGGVSKGEETMARNIQISLAARVQEASAKFRKSQSAYLKKLRGIEGLPSPTFESRPAIPAQNPYMDPSLMDSEVDKSFSQSTLSQLQTTQLRQHAPMATSSNDAAIAQREREINDIAKGIIELSDIFKDLQAMVIDQGTMLDRIDYNVERMTTEVKGAERELKVATNYQRRNTKRKILLLLFIIVLGLFILLLVKPKKHGRSSSSEKIRRKSRRDVNIQFSPPPLPEVLIIDQLSLSSPPSSSSSYPSSTPSIFSLDESPIYSSKTRIRRRSRVVDNDANSSREKLTPQRPSSPSSSYVSNQAKGKEAESDSEAHRQFSTAMEEGQGVRAG